MGRENRPNTDMEKSNFSVRSLDATADLIKNTQKLDCFSKLLKGCRLVSAFKANGSVAVGFLHVIVLTF